SAKHVPPIANPKPKAPNLKPSDVTESDQVDSSGSEKGDDSGSEEEGDEEEDEKKAEDEEDEKEGDEEEGDKEDGDEEEDEEDGDKQDDEEKCDGDEEDEKKGDEEDDEKEGNEEEDEKEGNEEDDEKEATNNNKSCLNPTYTPTTTASKTLLISSSHPRISVVAALSSSTGTSELSLETSSLLERVEVFDVNGNSILISDLWKDRKAVVAFARHFGCVLCRKRADMLAAKKDRMDASGVALVLIGPGSVDQARTFSEQTNFKGEVYADPSYASYKALSFVSGVTTTFTPGSALKIIEAYMEGYRQDWELSFEKDTRTRGGWQQGGIIVAGPGISNISYIHKDKEAGDDPEVEEIMKVCCA
nr:thioredoxin-like protein AAED1, chloroplastic [Tanacetum cinerariifolium]